VTEILAQFGATIGSVLGAAPVLIGARLLLGYFVLLWFAAALWIYYDCRGRMSGHLGPYVAAGAAILATPLFAPLVWILYRLLRPARTADDVAEQHLTALVAAAAPPGRPTCPDCGAVADPGWQVCPLCATQMREECPRCDAVVDLDWAICPFCECELRPEEEAIAAAVEAPTRRRRRLRAPRAVPFPGQVLRPRHQMH